jgi:hypothetical protein
MMEFASPTTNRKNALTEDPEGNFLVHLAVAELCHDMTWLRTNYSTDLSNAIDLIGHIGADSDGHILLGRSHQ